MYGIIYKVTNRVNGKVYIGQTVRALKSRKSNHLIDANNGSNVVFHRAIRKYGENNFHWEIIDTADNEKELDDKEIYWIDKCRSYIHYEDSNGYNMTLGGDGNKGWKMSEEHKEIVSKTHKGKILSEDTRRKISENCDNKGENNPMFNKKHSDESIFKNRINQPKRKSVLQFSTDGVLIKEYNALIEAERELGIDRTSLTRTCRGEQIHSLNYIWLYKDDYTPELLNRRIDKYKSFNKNKGIVQLSKDGEFINEFKDSVECANSIGGDQSAVLKCCKGKLKTHKGYVFKYKSDYYNYSEVV